MLSELGGDAGVVGAARLISDAVYAVGLITTFASNLRITLANFRLAA